MRARRVFGLLLMGLTLTYGSAQAADPLTICVNENAAPYSVRLKTGAAGFDLAVAAALAQRLGRPLILQWFEDKLDFESSSALEANAMLSDGRCQLVAGYPLSEDALGKPGSPTARLPGFEGALPADRRRKVELGTLQASKPYHFAPLTIILGGGALGKSITSLADLDGVRIGTEGGTLGDAILMLFDGGRLIDRITHFAPGRGQLWPGLERGDVDATLAPLHRFDAYRTQHKDTRLRPSGYVYPLGFNLGFAGLARDAALLAEVDASLAAMLASGEIAALAPAAGMTYEAPRAPDIRKPVQTSDLQKP